MIHRHDTDPLEILTPGVIDGVGLHHADEERTVISRLVTELADVDTASRSSATIDGLAIA